MTPDEYLEGMRAVLWTLAYWKRMPALTTMGPLFLTSIPHPGPDRVTGMICLTSSPSVQPSALA